MGVVVGGGGRVAVGFVARIRCSGEAKATKERPYHSVLVAVESGEGVVAADAYEVPVAVVSRSTCRNSSE